MELKEHIRAIPDFPKAGILFRDISPLLANPGALRHVIDVLEERYRSSEVDKIVAVESRGFLFGAPLAVCLGVGLVLVRKAGKLPAATHSMGYSLEYGESRLEIHQDALGDGDNVILIDDLLATGGTAAAAGHLVEKTGARVAEIAFLVELDGLGGREALKRWNVHSLVAYGDED